MDFQPPPLRRGGVWGSQRLNREAGVGLPLECHQKCNRVTMNALGIKLPVGVEMFQP